MPRKFLVAALLVAVGFGLAAGPAGAVSGFGGGSNSPAVDLTAAQKAVDAGDYAKAIEQLDKAVKTDPTSAEAYNMLGYSFRKLGDIEVAFEHYHKALSLDRNHRGANEYIGELYLETGDLAKAEEHLNRLGKACAYSCPEYQELKTAVTAYKAGQGS